MAASSWRSVVSVGWRQRQVQSPRATLAVETLAEVMPFDAVALSAWDPLAGRHRNVAMLGPPEEIRAASREDPFLDDAGYRHIRARRAPHRRCDVPGARENALIAERPEPAGFAEGVTSWLFTRDGRYTGVLNLASRSDEPANAETMLLIAVIGDALARSSTSRARSMPPWTRSIRTWGRRSSTSTAAAHRCKAGPPVRRCAAAGPVV